MRDRDLLVHKYTVERNWEGKSDEAIHASDFSGIPQPKAMKMTFWRKFLSIKCGTQFNISGLNSRPVVF